MRKLIKLRSIWICLSIFRIDRRPAASGTDSDSDISVFFQENSPVKCEHQRTICSQPAIVHCAQLKADSELLPDVCASLTQS
ncbi:MAG: hypothetical protein AAF644_06905, partial [Pseudomonadota bacterium]